MNKLTGTIYKIDGTLEAVELKPKHTLRNLQKIVGGYIDVIHVSGNDLVINDEGRLLDLPVNPWGPTITKGTMWEHEDFRGDIVLINGKLR